MGIVQGGSKIAKRLEMNFQPYILKIIIYANPFATFAPLCTQSILCIYSQVLTKRRVTSLK